MDWMDLNLFQSNEHSKSIRIRQSNLVLYFTLVHSNSMQNSLISFDCSICIWNWPNFQALVQNLQTQIKGTEADTLIILAINTQLKVFYPSNQKFDQMYAPLASYILKCSEDVNPCFFFKVNQYNTILWAWPYQPPVLFDCCNQVMILHHY